MSDTATTEATATATDEGWEWMIVEVMGHRSHAGRVREEERFGAKMMRIDIPIKGDAMANGWETRYYAPTALFSYSLTDEASVMKANKPWEPPARLKYRERPNVVDEFDPFKGEAALEEDEEPESELSNDDDDLVS